MRGKYEREEVIDRELQGIGVRFEDKTLDVPMKADVEPAEDAEPTGLWASVKHAALFLGLTVGIVVCENMGLMAEVIAVPGMLACAACFGWHIRK